MTHGVLHGSEHGKGADLVIDMVAKALARMYVGFDESANILAVTEWVAEQLHQVEEILHDLAWFTFPDSAHGKVLDALADNYSFKRAGLSDSQLSNVLLALPPALSQHRTADVMIRLLEALIIGTGTTYTYDEPEAMYIYVVLSDIDAETAEHWRLVVLERARAEAVRMIAGVIIDSANAFTYDTGPGYDVGIYAHAVES